MKDDAFCRLGIEDIPTPDWSTSPPEDEPSSDEQSETKGDGADNVLARINRRYAVVREGGKTRVLSFEPHLGREAATLQSFEDFRNFHLNEIVQVPGQKPMPAGHWWLKHPERRQFDGFVFKPGSAEVINGRLNLWRGWGVELKRGGWPLMARHILDVLASGNLQVFEYITNWMAWTVQNPDKPAEVALVFQGGRGSGKGVVARSLCRIFGQHGLHISSAMHLAGRFNAHLRDVCVLFADEAYWPGDKAAEGSLKRLITEPELFIEAKGRDAITVENRLHVIMASNEDWIVPAGIDERRFGVFRVSDHKKQDPSYFKPLYAEIENGGLSAMLFDLLNVDLKGWHPRNLVTTQALKEQQVRSLLPEDEWWVELLETGLLQGADPKDPSCAVSGTYTRKEESYSGSRIVTCKGLYDQARTISPRLKHRSDIVLGHELSSRGCVSKRVLRARGFQFPPLQEARRAWEARFPGWQWRDPTLTDWQSVDD
jgi:hypothetical protein